MQALISSQVKSFATN